MKNKMANIALDLLTEIICRPDQNTDNVPVPVGGTVRHGGNDV